MGIFSDIFEENRCNNNIDLGLYISRGHINVVSEFMDKYYSKERQKHAEKSMNTACDHINEEYIKSNIFINRKTYIEEKIVRRLLNSNYESALFNNIIEQLLKEIMKQRRFTNNIIEKHRKLIKVEEPKFDEDKLKIGLSEIILLSIYKFLSTDANMERSEFRLCIYDCAKLLLEYQKEIFNNKNMLKSEIVEKYFTEEFGLTRSYIKCLNCGNSIYNEIPYCFNCYEKVN